MFHRLADFQCKQRKAEQYNKLVKGIITKRFYATRTTIIKITPNAFRVKLHKIQVKT